MDIATIVVLVIAFLFVVGMSGSFILTQMVSARIRSQAATRDELYELQEALRELMESNDALSGEVAELQDRVDKTERLLESGE